MAKARKVRSRIAELATISGREIAEHPDQYRFHPKAERDAFRGLVDEIGIAEAVLAYRSERNDGALVLINGHMRISEYPDADWPVLITDLNDDEADLMLATMDDLSAMGEIGDTKRHAALLDRLEAKSPALRAMLTRARQKAKIAGLMEKARAQLDHPLNEAGGGADDRGLGLRTDRVRVRPIVWIEDLAQFERAMRATKIMNRGDAMAEICRVYLETIDGRSSEKET